MSLAKNILVTLCVTGGALASACRSTNLSHAEYKDVSADPLLSGPYMIKAQMEFVKPIALDAMQTSWQTAKLISETQNTVTYEISLNPLYDFSPPSQGNPNWQRDNAAAPALAPYLVPGVTTNWDNAMREDLIRTLREDGIDIAQLTDLEVVRKVSEWLFSQRGGRFTYHSLFIPYYVKFQNGGVIVPDELRFVFDAEKRRDNIQTDADAFEAGLFGRTMYLKRRRGDCTASAILQATVLKALGIPTRIVMSTSLADANNASQFDLVKNHMRHEHTRKRLLEGLAQQQNSWSNHSFNEVYINGRWVRLNYNELGQPVVDRYYLGLMVQVARVNDWSEANLTTWGLHQVQQKPAGFSYNPYRLISLEDRFFDADFERQNQGPFQELKQIKMTSIKHVTDSSLSQSVRNNIPSSAQFFVTIDTSDSLTYDYVYFRLFRQKASEAFGLRADGVPEVSLRIAGTQTNPEEQYAGFYLYAFDSSAMRSGVTYTLQAPPFVGEYGWLQDAPLTIKAR